MCYISNSYFLLEKNTKGHIPGFKEILNQNSAILTWQLYTSQLYLSTVNIIERSIILIQE